MCVTTRVIHQFLCHFCVLHHFLCRDYCPLVLRLLPLRVTSSSPVCSIITRICGAIVRAAITIVDFAAARHFAEAVQYAEHHACTPRFPQRCKHVRDITRQTSRILVRPHTRRCAASRTHTSMRNIAHTHIHARALTSTHPCSTSHLHTIPSMPAVAAHRGRDQGHADGSGDEGAARHDPPCVQHHTCDTFATSYLHVCNIILAHAQHHISMCATSHQHCATSYLNVCNIIPAFCQHRTCTCTTSYQHVCNNTSTFAAFAQHRIRTQ